MVRVMATVTVTVRRRMPMGYRAKLNSRHGIQVIPILGLRARVGEVLDLWDANGGIY